MIFDDTSPEVEAFLLEQLRQMAGQRKLAMIGELNQAVRQLLLGGLRARHPEATPAELQRLVADALLGPELAEKVYGPLDRIVDGD